MGKVLVTIDGKDILLERQGPKKIGLYLSEDSEEPYATVIIPQEYTGFTKRHRPGQGHDRIYAFHMHWLVENVPGIQEAIRQKLPLHQQIGV
ncbi:MAG: hypothetical protein HYT72_04985 [Candidatus Aenigmarchaeota archaeon]|nr:hypothetical protein [Candidatus Aenigmarchaeota archaeon]